MGKGEGRIYIMGEVLGKREGRKISIDRGKKE